jgi:hypothetical protein
MLNYFTTIRSRLPIVCHKRWTIAECIGTAASHAFMVACLGRGRPERSLTGAEVAAAASREMKSIRYGLRFASIRETLVSARASGLDRAALLRSLRGRGPQMTTLPTRRGLSRPHHVASPANDRSFEVDIGEQRSRLLVLAAYVNDYYTPLTPRSENWREGRRGNYQ